MSYVIKENTVTHEHDGYNDHYAPYGKSFNTFWISGCMWIHIDKDGQNKELFCVYKDVLSYMVFSFLK